MAFVIPKCAHGKPMVQLFYHTSWVCSDECMRGVVTVARQTFLERIKEFNPITRLFRDLKSLWERGGCPVCGLSDRDKCTWAHTTCYTYLSGQATLDKAWEFLYKNITSW